MSNYDTQVLDAIRIDTMQREWKRRGAEVERQDHAELQRMQRAWDFEHGDHQPDGTIGPAPGKYPYRLPDNPVMQGGWTASGERLQECAQIRGGELCVDKFSPEDYKVACGGDYAAQKQPSPGIQRALAQMEQRLVQQQRDRVEPADEVLVVQITLNPSREDKAKIDAAPQALQRVIAQLRREFAYEMLHEFGITVKQD